MKVLVTGSGGVLGSNLVSYLLEKNNFDVKGFDISPVRNEHKDKIEFVQGDITCKADVEKACQGVDLIVHAASASPAFSESKIFDIVIDGTCNLLDEAHRIGIKRFVHISSTAVYGIPDRVPMLESDEVQPYHDPYNRAKAKAEIVCNSFRIRGMCLPVLRPRTFLGPQRLGTFAMLFEWAREGRHFPMLGKGTNRYQFLDVEDLCQAVYLALTQPEDQVNDIFNIGAKEFGSMKETYQAVLDAAGHGKRIKCIPAKPAMLVLDLLSALKLSPLYKRLYQKLNIDYFASIDKAEERLGYSPRYSNNETLVRSYQWYCSEVEKLSSESGSGNNTPWNQGVLKLGKVFF